jgi:hypothetical protein
MQPDITYSLNNESQQTHILITVSILCPMEEDLGILMLSVVFNVRMSGREGGKKGAMGVEQGD